MMRGLLNKDSFEVIIVQQIVSSGKNKIMRAYEKNEIQESNGYFKDQVFSLH